MYFVTQQGWLGIHFDGLVCINTHTYSKTTTTIAYLS
jgi:hypothetical protein